jgi:hypothetical protein
VYYSVCHTLTLYTGSQARMAFEHLRSDTKSANPKYSDKTCHSANLFTTYLTEIGWNLFVRKEICLSIRIHMYVCVCIYVCMYVCMCVYVCMFFLNIVY